MRESFGAALDSLRQQSEGWLLLNNLRKLSAATPEEVDSFMSVWAGLAERHRFQLAGALVDAAAVSGELTLEPLFEVILDDESAEVRCAALEGLDEVVDSRLADKLVVMLATDPEAQVRADVATLLGLYLSECEGVEEEEHDTRRRVEDALLEAINTDSEEVLVRQRALEAYGYAEDPYVDEVIMDSYDGDEDEMRASAVFAMGRRMDEEWLTIVHREMDNEVPEMRLAAIYAAAHIGSGASVPYLLRVIGEDVSEDVRIAAVYGLAEIESPEAERLLQDLLESSDEVILAAASEALEMWSTREDLSDMVLFDYGPGGDDDSDDAPAQEEDENDNY